MILNSNTLFENYKIIRFFLVALTFMFSVEIKCQNYYSLNSGYLFSNSNDNTKYISNGIIGDFTPVQLKYNNYSSISSFLFFKKNEIILSNLINPELEKDEIIVFPTIASSTLNIKTNIITPNNSINFQICDILGRIKYSDYLLGPSTELDIKMLTEGTYFIRFYKEKNQVYQRKFIVIN